MSDLVKNTTSKNFEKLFAKTKDILANVLRVRVLCSLRLDILNTEVNKIKTSPIYFYGAGRCVKNTPPEMAKV